MSYMPGFTGDRDNEIADALNIEDDVEIWSCPSCGTEYELDHLPGCQA